MFAIGPCIGSLVGSCACSACTCVSREVLRRSARVAYSALFLASMIMAWIMRDFAKPLIDKIPWIVKDVTKFHPTEDWYGAQAVYRVSCGSFLFYATMAMAMYGVKYKSDQRDKFLHHGHWLLKLGLWLVFSALPFFLPNSVIAAYSWAARAGSGVFLIVQMFILLEFTHSWNDTWVAAGEEDDNWLYGLLAVTIGAFAGTLSLAVVLYVLFNPVHAAGGCSFNIAIITLTLLVCVSFSVLSLHPAAKHGSLFPSSAISLYAMYLCYSALQSEPKDYACNGVAKWNAASGSTLVIGMVLTIVSVMYSAFRAGSNTSIFSLSEDGDGGGGRSQPLLRGGDQESLLSSGLDGEPLTDTGRSTRAAEVRETALDEFEPVTYNYSFFHFIFALASMYIAMLMTGWGSGELVKDRIDVGWPSVWVKVGALLTTSGLYVWTLLAPTLMPDREFW